MTLVSRSVEARNHTARLGDFRAAIRTGLAPWDSHQGPCRATRYSCGNRALASRRGLPVIGHSAGFELMVRHGACIHEGGPMCVRLVACSTGGSACVCSTCPSPGRSFFLENSQNPGRFSGFEVDQKNTRSPPRLA